MKTTAISNTDPKSKKAYAKPVSTSIAIMHPAILDGSPPYVPVNPNTPTVDAFNKDDTAGGDPPLHKDDTAGGEQDDLW